MKFGIYIDSASLKTMKHHIVWQIEHALLYTHNFHDRFLDRTTIIERQVQIS